MKALFISGTGTEVGKTFATAVIASLASDAGLRVAAMKPVQTGAESAHDGDIARIRSLAPNIIPLPQRLECPCIFKLPASPHLAAEREGVEISLESITAAFAEIAAESKPDLLLVEGAGGICAPLNRKQTNCDLIKALAIPAAVVSLSGLGAINHCLLTINELKRNSIEVSGFIMNRMPKEPGLIEADNARTIESLSGVPILMAIPDSNAFPEFRLKDAPRLASIIGL